jgi:hypothetical protein
MRHHFRYPQAMFNKGSLFYCHCGLYLIPFKTISALIILIQRFYCGRQGISCVRLSFSPEATNAQCIFWPIFVRLRVKLKIKLFKNRLVFLL